MSSGLTARAAEVGAWSVVASRAVGITVLADLGHRSHLHERGRTTASGHEDSAIDGVGSAGEEATAEALYVSDGKELEKEGGVKDQEVQMAGDRYGPLRWIQPPEAEQIDLGDEVTTLCLAPERRGAIGPGVIAVDPAQKLHVIVSVHRHRAHSASSMRPRARRSNASAPPGEGGVRQAHAAAFARRHPHPGGQPERRAIRGIRPTTHNTLQLDTGARIDLANCTTPYGLPCQLAGLRPDDAPIYPIYRSSSRLGFVTLRGGGNSW